MTVEGGDESLKAIIQGIVGKGTEIWVGTVKSTAPLRIQATNDEKLTIGPNITIIPRHLTDYEATVDVDLGEGQIVSSTRQDGTHTHALASFSLKGAKMKVYNALKVGETVHVLSFNHGKQHYILDRVV